MAKKKVIELVAGDIPVVEKLPEPAPEREKKISQYFLDMYGNNNPFSFDK